MAFACCDQCLLMNFLVYICNCFMLSKRQRSSSRCNSTTVSCKWTNIGSWCSSIQCNLHCTATAVWLALVRVIQFYMLSPVWRRKLRSATWCIVWQAHNKDSTLSAHLAVKANLHCCSSLIHDDSVWSQQGTAVANKLQEVSKQIYMWHDTYNKLSLTLLVFIASCTTLLIWWSLQSNTLPCHFARLQYNVF